MLDPLVFRPHNSLAVFSHHHSGIMHFHPAPQSRKERDETKNQVTKDAGSCLAPSNEELKHVKVGT